MQVYQGLDIATAKATPAEQARVKHHLIDVVTPSQPYSVADYQKQARLAIDDIVKRGKLPLIVGGSGLYIRAALAPYQFSDQGRASIYRDELQQRATREGVSALHDELKTIDPITASKVHPNDLKRIIRALEVYYLTNEPLSLALERTEKAEPLYNALWIGLRRDRDELYERIDRRVEEMIASGLLEEMEKLRHSGWQPMGIAGQALGYKEFWPYLEGYISFETAMASLQQETRRYAKRQMSWFRSEKQIKWYDLNQDSDPAICAAELASWVKAYFPVIS